MNLDPQHTKTYSIVTPVHTHWRKATCEEVNCKYFLNGWETKVDESTDLGQRQAYYIRNTAKRKYTEERVGSITTFTFPAGQVCFGSDRHRVLNGRQEMFVVRDGGTPARVHQRPEDWVDDFATHQDHIKRILERG